MTEKKLTQGSGRFKSLPWIGMAALSGLMLPPPSWSVDGDGEHTRSKKTG